MAGWTCCGVENTTETCSNCGAEANTFQKIALRQSQDCGWQCLSCLSRNKESSNQCLACEVARPGFEPEEEGKKAAKSTSGAFSFSATPSSSSTPFAFNAGGGGGGGGFTFGTSTATAEATGGFTFGASTGDKSDDMEEEEEEREECTIARDTKKVKKGDTVVLVCGQGGFGALGLGDDEALYESRRPRVINSLIGKEIASICTGGMINAVVARDGAPVLTWGQDDQGALGREGGEYDPEPVTFPTADDDSDSDDMDEEEEEMPPRIKKVTQGNCHTAFLTDSGQVYTCGSFKDEHGIIGHHVEDGVVVEEQTTPRLVAGLTDVVDIASGVNHILACDSRGRLWSWGVPSLGQRTNERTKLRWLTPHIATYARGKRQQFARVYCGAHTNYALSRSGGLYSWGQNVFLQTGHPNKANSSCTVIDSPHKLLFSDEVSIVDVAPGTEHVLCLDDRGDVWTFGRNGSGEIGRNTTLPEDVVEEMEVDGAPKTNPEKAPKKKFAKELSPDWRPTKIEVPDRVLRIGVGASHSFLVTKTNVYCFGFGAQYRMGEGTTRSFTVPTPVFDDGDLTGFTVVEVRGGAQHSLFLLQKNGGSKNAMKFPTPSPVSTALARSSSSSTSSVSGRKRRQTGSSVASSSSRAPTRTSKRSRR